MGHHVNRKARLQEQRRDGLSPRDPGGAQHKRVCTNYSCTNEKTHRVRQSRADAPFGKTPNYQGLPVFCADGLAPVIAL